MPIAKLGAIELYYERAGQGAPLLFISGTGGDLRVKPNVFDGALANAFDVLAYDQRGLGRSSKPEVDYSMADYADDAAALLDHVGWPKAKVMGASFGGMVAQELVLRHPAKVEKLVLACTSPGGAGGASYPLHEIQHLKGEERARHMLAISDTRLGAAWAAANPEDYARFVALVADAFAGEPGREVGLRRQLAARAGHDTWGRLRGGAGHDTWDRLQQIRCPVLIAAGRFDGIALPETQHRLAGRIAGASLR